MKIGLNLNNFAVPKYNKANNKQNFKLKSLSLNCDSVSFKSNKPAKKPINAVEIFNQYGIQTTELLDGELFISHYCQPISLDDEDLSFSKLGINEDELLKNVVAIEGNADFSGSSAKTLGGICYVGGNLTLSDSDVEDSGELRAVDGNINLMNSKLKSLGKVKKVKGNIFLNDSSAIKTSDLGELSNKAVKFDQGYFRDIIEQRDKI